MKTSHGLWLVACLGVNLVAGCVTEQPADQRVESSQPTSTPWPTLSPRITPTAIPSPIAATAATSESLPVTMVTPTGPIPPGQLAPIVLATSQPMTAVLPLGLIYQTSISHIASVYTLPAFWRVGADGVSVKLSDALLGGGDTLDTPFAPAVAFSDDGTQALIGIRDAAQHSEVWIVDAQTGARKQLTHDPERNNWYPRWWPGRPNTILFMSTPVTQNMGMFINGNLGMVNLDGSGYKTFPETDYQQTVPATDGRTLLRWQFGPAGVFTFTLEGQTGQVNLGSTSSAIATSAATNPQPPMMCLADGAAISQASLSPDGALLLVESPACVGGPSQPTYSVTLRSWAAPELTLVTFTRTWPAVPTLSTLVPSWSGDSQYVAVVSSGRNLLTGMGIPPDSSNDSIQIVDRTGKLIRRIEHANDEVLSLHWRPGAHELVYVLVSAAMFSAQLPPPQLSGSAPPANPAETNSSKVVVLDVDTGTSREIDVPQQIVVRAWVR